MKTLLVAVCMLWMVGTAAAQRMLLVSKPGTNHVWLRGDEIKFQVKDDPERYHALIESVDSLTMTLLVAGHPAFDIPIDQIQTIYVYKSHRTVRFLRALGGTLPFAALVYFGMDAFNSSRRGEQAIARSTVMVSGSLLAASGLAFLLAKPKRVRIGRGGYAAKSLRAEGLERALQMKKG